MIFIMWKANHWLGLRYLMVFLSAYVCTSIDIKKRPRGGVGGGRGAEEDRAREQGQKSKKKNRKTTDVPGTSQTYQEQANLPYLSSECVLCDKAPKKNPA